MPRKYEIPVKISKNSNFCSVDITVSGGETFENVTLKRLFPVNSINEYISVISPEGKELFIIKELSTLQEDSYACALDFLNNFYMIPKILKVFGKKDKFGRLVIDVLTDIGECSIEIANRNTDIKVREDGRVTFKDVNDNRYEIKNIAELDRRSIAILDSDL